MKPLDQVTNTKVDEYEKLEHQRKNPHLYTTLTQSVNCDGSITTYEQVTRKLQETFDKLQELHIKSFGGVHPEYCMRPLIGHSENPMCQSIEMYKKDMDRCLEIFVRNYRMVHNKTENLKEQL